MTSTRVPEFGRLAIKAAIFPTSPFVTRNDGGPAATFVLEGVWKVGGLTCFLLFLILATVFLIRIYGCGCCGQKCRGSPMAFILCWRDFVLTSPAPQKCAYLQPTAQPTAQLLNRPQAPSSVLRKDPSSLPMQSHSPIKPHSKRPARAENLKVSKKAIWVSLFETFTGVLNFV